MLVVGHDQKTASEAAVLFEASRERPALVPVQNVLTVRYTDASNAETVETVEQIVA